jgi:hypothetical protein
MLCGECKQHIESFLDDCRSLLFVGFLSLLPRPLPLPPLLLLLLLLLLRRVWQFQIPRSKIQR